ncbi:MAG: WcaI family glycosyltransferase [Roseiarcus sp.]|jgi:colanic acid biosynthesis glycosyl transferase WcaI
MARILIYAMNYSPEVAGVARYTGEIALYFVAMGHKVCVLTTVPHYPGWNVLPPYRNGRYYRETRASVSVVRCPLALRERIGGIWRLIAPLSFAVTSAPLALWLALRHRPDTVLCIEPTLMVAPMAVIAARLVGAKTVLHVQDLEVDASFAVGHLAKRAWLMRLAEGLERAILRRFDRLITISAGMAERLAAKGVPSDRIAVVRNWVDLDFIKPLEGVSPYREELGLNEGDRIVLYSGNIGAKQGLGDLIAAASDLTRRADIKFVIAGEGPAKKELVERAARLPNVRFLPFQPYARLSDFLGLADVHVLPQAADAADLVLPSKLGGMLASGRRIVVTAAPGTELATFLDGAAIIVPPGDAATLARAIERAADAPFNEGAAGRRRRLAEQLSKPDGLRNFKALAVRWGPIPAALAAPGAGTAEVLEPPRDAAG